MKDSVSTWLTVGFLALLGGVAASMRDLLAGEQFAWWRLCAKLTISAFAGVVVFTLLRECGLSPELASAGAGIAGHAGSSIITVLERMLVAVLEALAKRAP